MKEYLSIIIIVSIAMLAIINPCYESEGVGGVPVIWFLGRMKIDSKRTTIRTK